MSSFKIISAHQFGPRQWDAFCETSFPGHIEYRFEYFNAIWPSWHLLVDQKTGQPVLPIFFRSWDVGQLFPAMPLFIQKLPLNPQTDLISLVHFLKKRFLRFHFSLTLNTDYKDQFSRRVNLYLDLSPDTDHLWKGFSENLKRNLKKAGGNNLTFSRHQQMEAFIKHYKQGLTQEQWAMSKKAEKSLLRIAELKHSLLIAEVSEGSEVLASAIFLMGKHRIIYLLGSTTSKGREKQAIAWLFWSIIQEERADGRILDFEGGNLPGLFRFFSSFGAIEEYFYTLQYTRKLL